MNNFSKSLVAVVGLVAGLGLLGSAFVKPAAALGYENVDRAVTLSGAPGETMVATSTGNVIDLPPMIITGDAHPVKLLPFHAERCASLIARFGDDADYRCPRHASKPAVKVSRTFVHSLAQGGSPDAPTVIVHDYQDAE